MFGLRLLPKTWLVLVSLAFGWTLIFWLSCIGIPLSRIFWQASQPEAVRAFLDPSILAVVGATFMQAAVSTGIAGWMGLLLGLYFGSHLSKKNLLWIQSLLAIPMGVPVIVASSAWIGWMGRSGILAGLGWTVDWIYSWKAVILAHVFFNIPWVALCVSEARARVGRDVLEAARNLGAGLLAEFAFILWPQIRISFLSACAQVFAFCAMSFALVLLLGGGPPVQTLETELYQRVRYGEVDLSGAVACAIWEILIILGPWFLFQKRRNLSRWNEVSESVPVSESSRGAFPLSLGVAGFFILPYFGVFHPNFLNKFLDGHWLSHLLSPIQTSLLLALSVGALTLVTVFAAMITLIVLYRRPCFVRWGERLLTLPSGISVLVLGLGFWFAYPVLLESGEGCVLAILMLQVALFFPFVFRMLWPFAQKFHLDQWEAASLLGASLFQIGRWVEWPLWKRPVLCAFAGVMGASLGEVAIVSLFYHEKVISLPLVVSQWMIQYRFEEAQAATGILFLLCLALTVISLIIGKDLS